MEKRYWGIWWLYPVPLGRKPSEYDRGKQRVSRGQHMSERQTAEAMREAAAKIAEGNVVREHYRTWPQWSPIGDRSHEWDGSRLALATAAAIRALPLPDAPPVHMTGQLADKDAEIARLSAARRPFSDALAARTINIQVKELDQLRAHIAILRNLIATARPFVLMHAPDHIIEQIDRELKVE